jgi:hypothetical protein
MELREIAAISGKPGLYQILKPSKAGVIVETIDENHTRFLAAATSKISILSEITMYTTDAKGAITLREVFANIQKQFGDNMTLTAKSDGADLHELMATVVPDYDRDKVYTSDLKKLVTWYSILHKYAPEAFDEPAVDAPSEATEDKAS